MFTFVEAAYTLLLTLIISSPLLIYCLSNTPNKIKGQKRKHHRLPLLGVFFSRTVPGDNANSKFYDDFENYQAKNAFYRNGEYPTSVLSPLHWFTDWGMAVIYMVATVPFVWVMVKFINHVLFAQQDPMTWTDSNQHHFEASFWLFFIYIIVAWIWAFVFLHMRSKAWSIILGVCVIGSLVAFYVVLGLTLHNFGVDAGKFDTAYWLTLGYVILVAGVGLISWLTTIGEYLFTDKKKRRSVSRPL
jgi:RsiW-degrading membrane proteinase PrsW (M82 family)